MNPIVSLFDVYSRRSRGRRARVLREYIDPAPEWRILDLGGGTGAHINRVFPHHRNIVICDLLAADLEVARKVYGYETVQADGTDRLPFSDGEFDFVFCSSVIEHVTGPKDEVLRIADGETFREMAWDNQSRFAAEVRRIAKRYYVQTPHKYFPVESHSWMPNIYPMINRRHHIRLLSAINTSTVWPKKTEPDWNLLTPSEMRELFPDARIFIERSLGLPKSIFALKAAA